MTTPPELDRFFAPSTVAVVGASDTEGRPTTLNWRLLHRWATRVSADVYPVNPNREQVDGVTCWKALGDVPVPLDVVAVLIGDAHGAVSEAVELKARFVVVFSSGYAEVGEEGRRAQQRLADLVGGSSTRLIGPNTNLNAFEEFRTDLGGPAIALISQSGHQGRPLFMAQDNGIRVSHWAPTGNEADLELSDFVTWFADQDHIGCIAAYVEGFAHGHRFVEAARHAVEADTPITLVKVGRTPAGRSAAATHTGKLAGGDRVADGLFRQLGITRVDTLDMLSDTAQVLARAGRPTSDGVALYSISGGTGAHLADLCGQAGLRLARFAEPTLAVLRDCIPDYLTVANPVDCGGHPVGDERGPRILDALLADPDVGALVCPITGPFPPLSDKLAADLVAAAEASDKLVCVVWGSPVGTEPALREVLLASSRLAVFRSSGNCVAAVSAWQAWHRFRAGYQRPTAAPTSGGPPAAAQAALARTGTGSLNEHDSKSVLAAYGVPVTRELLVADEAAALDAAEALGYPVVLKACVAALAHKSDHGLVRVGIESPAQLTEAYHALAARAEAVAPGPIDGMLVCEHIAGGVEASVGVVRDPELGHAVMVGVGGIFVEAFDDVAFRVPPFTEADAHQMVGDLRGSTLLGSLRGRPPGDRQALVEVIMAVQQLVLDLGDQLGELDLNPVVVRPRGEGAVVVDALVVLDDGTERP